MQKIATNLTILRQKKMTFRDRSHRWSRRVNSSSACRIKLTQWRSLKRMKISSTLICQTRRATKTKKLRISSSLSRNLIKNLNLLSSNLWKTFSHLTLRLKTLHRSLRALCKLMVSRLCLSIHNSHKRTLGITNSSQLADILTQASSSSSHRCLEPPQWLILTSTSTSITSSQCNQQQCSSRTALVAPCPTLQWSNNRWLHNQCTAQEGPCLPQTKWRKCIRNR